MKRIIGLAVLLPLSACNADCGPQPTKAIYTQQRKTPFFRVLTYELLQTRAEGGLGGTEVLLFEDEAGGCYITSGKDGGVVVAPKSSCEAVKAPPSVEIPK